jgi:hypothetical protein
MSTLANNWSKISTYLKEGLSIIPVRDKVENKNGKEYLPKTPYYGWKEFQINQITEQALYQAMEAFDTSAIAIIAGKVSGNLEVIDIDVKNWAGVDALLFTTLNGLYPEIFKSLRIHKTPSGGYHILYRIHNHEPEGNLKLAYSNTGKEAAIETRGEGGYIVAPPSLNYFVHQSNPIPVITWEERNSIISVCRSLNQKIKPAKQITTSKNHNDYYSENPFEHFNNSDAAERVLLDYGWEIEGETPRYIYFTRPGKKTGISASFDRETKCYYIFTSSTEFEPSKGYLPATVLAKLGFNDDKKLCFADLIKRGFGKIKPEAEKKKAKKLAMEGKQVPPNFSKSAIELHAAISQKLTEEHP